MAQVRKTVVVKNRQGLHARPAAMFVQIANKYECDIAVRKGDQEVNGKSIMGIMMLAAERGSRIQIICDGDDADDALIELEKLLQDKLK